MITYGIVAAGIIGAVLLVATLTSSDDPDQPLDLSADEPAADEPDAEQPDAAEPDTDGTADAVVTEFVYGSGDCHPPG